MTSGQPLTDADLTSADLAASKLSGATLDGAELGSFERGPTGYARLQPLSSRARRRDGLHPMV